jgi:predicted dehydrogenase
VATVNVRVGHANDTVVTNFTNVKIFLHTATESGYHATIAMTCLNAGCHLIVEKPIALSLKDADEMIALAEEKGLVLCACHQNRFNKSVQKIKEAVDCDRFGGLLHGAAHIRWTRTKDYYDQANWRGTWELDGGALMNQCIHNIDLLRWMMGGELTQVMAYTDRLNHDYIEAEDLGLALLKFKNGAYGLVEGTTNVYPTNLEETLYLFGRQGTVKAGGRSVNLIEEWNFADKADNSEEINTLNQACIKLQEDLDKQKKAAAKAAEKNIELSEQIHNLQKQNDELKCKADVFEIVDDAQFKASLKNL